jgi:hypothetical protein
LIVVDGVVLSESQVQPMNWTRSNSICKCIEGPQQLPLRGEGKNGAILITTKKNVTALQLLLQPTGLLLPTTVAWLGISTINRSTPAIGRGKGSAFQKFDQESQEKFTAKNVQEFCTWTALVTAMTGGLPRGLSKFPVQSFQASDRAAARQ